MAAVVPGAATAVVAEAAESEIDRVTEVA